MLPVQLNLQTGHILALIIQSNIDIKANISILTTIVPVVLVPLLWVQLIIIGSTLNIHYRLQNPWNALPEIEQSI